MSSMAFCILRWTVIATMFTISSAGEIGGLPIVTHSGYLHVDKEDGSQIFYTYYEAEEEVGKGTPVLLWLQVGLSSTSLN